MKRITAWLAAVLLWMTSAYAVPPVLNYAGKVTVDGEAYDGDGFFKFALVNEDGAKSYWSNDGTSTSGSEPQKFVSVPVQGGLYTVLLGNTALQGMSSMDPAVFAQHTNAKLRVWFSDGVNGFQQLSPDRPFASVPYAFSAGTAVTAGSASIAKGAVNLDMLSEDVKTQINAPISHARLSAEVKADINATIGMNRLSLEVTEKLEKEGSTFDYETPVVGSIKAVPYGDAPPVGYSLYQQGEPKDLVWEEKAPVSVGRMACDGVEVLDGKIYFVGGGNFSGSKNIAERYDPEANTWETLTSMSVNRGGVASAVLNGKLYAIGGQDLSSVEIYDTSTESWSSGVTLPSEVNHGAALTVNGKIYLIGGRNSSNQNISQVLCLDPSTNQWQAKASMPTARHGHKLVWFENRIWAIGGSNGSSTNKVESYDPTSNSWRVDATLTVNRHWPVAWASAENIFVAGGGNGGYINSLEIYDPIAGKWQNKGVLPQATATGDATTLNGKSYIVVAQTASGVFSNKVLAADLNATVEGVYDLYRKGGDAPVGTPVLQSEYADGSVTASKMADGAITTSKLSEQILKYLKPEITNQPQSSTIYAGQNASYSVTAEGKYLTYQWKKDGVDLTGETNATLNITDANATQHDGNYSVVVGNDFGSVESEEVALDVNTTLLNGLVGWWKFDETSGTVAYDSSGNGNHGTLTNGPTWTDGKIGGAINFDGINDYINVANYYGVSGNNPRTVSAWINTPLHSSNSKKVVEWGKCCGSGQIWSLGVAEDGRVRTDAVGSKYSSSVIGNNSWTFIANVFPPSKTKLENTRIFINGNFSSGASDMNININTKTDNNVLIGKGLAANKRWFQGLIDDVRIYDRALSAEEVQVLYNLGQ